MSTRREEGNVVRRRRRRCRRRRRRRHRGRHSIVDAPSIARGRRRHCSPTRTTSRPVLFFRRIFVDLYYLSTSLTREDEAQEMLNSTLRLAVHPNSHQVAWLRLFPL